MCCKRYHIIFSTFSLKFKCKICVQREVTHNFKNHILVTWRTYSFSENGAGLKNQITIILFKIWPTNRFSKAKSYNFHFHKNDVTWPLSTNGLSPFPFPLLKRILSMNFLNSLQSFQSSTCRQKEFNWIRYLSFFIWIQILHQPAQVNDIRENLPLCVKNSLLKTANVNSKPGHVVSRHMQLDVFAKKPQGLSLLRIKISNFSVYVKTRFFYSGLMTLIELVFMTSYTERHKLRGHLQ